MDHTEVVHHESARTEHLLRTRPDLTAPVAACGDWSAYDLATHLGGVHRWATAAISTPPDARVPSGPAEPAGLSSDELADWFAAGAGRLCTALGADPERPCWTLAEPRSVAFWRRRQAHETTVHRWDLETALGLPASLDPDVAADGVSEVLEVLLPRQIRLGRCKGSSTWVRVVVGGVEMALATGRERNASPLATLEGAAVDVLLVLWGRQGLDAVRVEGDVDALTGFLRGAITP